MHGWENRQSQYDSVRGEEVDTACFIVESTDTQLGDDGRGVQERHVQLDSQHGTHSPMRMCQISSTRGLKWSVPIAMSEEAPLITLTISRG